MKSEVIILKALLSKQKKSALDPENKEKKEIKLRKTE